MLASPKFFNNLSNDLRQGRPSTTVRKCCETTNNQKYIDVQKTTCPLKTTVYSELWGIFPFLIFYKWPILHV